MSDGQYKIERPTMDVSFVFGLNTLDKDASELVAELHELEEAFNQLLKERGYEVGGSFDQNYYPAVVNERLGDK